MACEGPCLAPYSGVRYATVTGERSPISPFPTSPRRMTYEGTHLMSLLSVAPLASVATENVEPAGGAPLIQLVIATIFAGTMTFGVLGIAWLHRSGRTTLLQKAGDTVGKIEGLPGWSAIPAMIGWASLGLAFFGVYWDISLHLDNGRDEGPLANLAHYPILFGLQGLFLAGALALVMPKKNDYVGPTAVRVAKGWRVPVASLTLMSCAVLGYLGFPLDDVWHRLFGQDVTLWGPTHLMMISGAVLCIVALAILQAEGERSFGAPKNIVQRARRRSPRILVPGAMLIALSLYLAEWDWGVQQYLMVWQPLLLAAGGAFALVFARRWGGPGVALAAAAFYAIARLFMNLVVGVGLDQSMPTMPLFFAEALVIEAVFRSEAMRHKTVLPVVLSGIGVGTVGFAAQYLWSQVAMPTPWTTELLAQGIPFAIIGGIAGSMIGLLFALALNGKLDLVQHRRAYGVGSAITLLALAGLAANQNYAPGPVVTATVVKDKQLRGTVGDGPQDGPIHEATVTLKFNPADVKDAQYVSTIAWQGGGLESNTMERIAPGVYRTTEPIPVGGPWKTASRIQVGRQLVAVPIYLPADPGIPVPALINPGTQTLRMQNELQYLQRERKPDVPDELWTPAIVLVLGLMALFAIALGFSAGRVGVRTKRDATTKTPEQKSSSPSRGPSPSTRVAYGPSDR